VQEKKLIALLNAVLNTYALLLFSNNRLLAMLLLVVSFFNPTAGLTGLISVIAAIAVANASGLAKWNIENGIFSYNALFIGIGMGTFYSWGTAFFVLLFVSILFSVVLSAVLNNWLSRLALPFLSLPFILCFWLILLVTKEFSAIDLSMRNVYWINEMYAVGDNRLVSFVMFMENLDLPPLVATFFRALSSVFFQNNILAGLLIATGILIHSRILFSLIVVGFLSAYAFNDLVKAYDSGINYYLLGVNFMMVSVAIGSFFVIPSFHSYLWAIISVPLTFIMVIGLGKIMSIWILPVFSLPYCITVLFLLFFFMLRTNNKRLVLTPLQLFSPEKNLYNYLNNKERLNYKNYYRLQLPFLGQWMVSQGYDGSITHKGDWSKALDFIIVDDELKTYSGQGTEPENFYCFNKPVLAPADGFVQEIIDYVDENEIGRINREQNWGNSIVLKHAEGLFTKMSHLRKNSFRVKTGDYVRKGDIIAAAGNSGRSPEPHLHFQVQATPFIGSKTIEYPFAFYIRDNENKRTIRNYDKPSEAELVSNVTANSALKKAFEFLPGYRMTVEAKGFAEESWEVLTDAWNQSYIFCYETNATAYFEQNEAFFYFTAFYGDQNSLLYHFYISAYKIFLGSERNVATQDIFPFQLTAGGVIKWLQDFIAPFYIFGRLHYESKTQTSGNELFNPSISIRSKQMMEFLTIKKLISESGIEIKDNEIISFNIEVNNKLIKAECSKRY